MARSSACCCSADNPFLDGQSMLSTVATHTPRNSRGTAGGPAAFAATPDKVKSNGHTQASTGREGKEGPPPGNRGERWATPGTWTNLRTTPGAAERFAESEDAH